MINTSHVPVAGTFSKNPSFYGRDYPIQYITRGSGSRVYDQNNRPYIDWVSGLGACILGYGDDAVRSGFTSHVSMYVKKGNGFSLPHQLEYTVAEKLCNVVGSRVPGWSSDDLQVRWLKTGSDACSAAIRLARAVTGKTWIMSYGYHGWGDDFVAMTPPAHGLLNSGEFFDERGMIPIGKLDIGRFDDTDDLAAVIVEYPAVDPDPAFWPALREFCNRHNALLIVDEVVTGLRYGLGGACERYDIHPDLVCLGKSLGNGLPIAALLGNKSYMSWFARTDPVFVSSTNAGDTASLAACDYVLSMWDDKSVDYIWEIGDVLMDGIKESGLRVFGHPARSVIDWRSDYEKAYVVQLLAHAGVIMNRPNFPTLSHNQHDVDQTITALQDIAFNLALMDDEKLKSVVLDMVGGEEGMPVALFRNR